MSRGALAFAGLLALVPVSATGRTAPAAIGTSDLSDRLRIEEAFARYAIALDAARGDAIASMFTPDARFRVMRTGGETIVDVRGRERIVPNLLSAKARQGDQRRHLVTNIVVDELTGTTAHATAYGVVVIAGGTARVDGTILYDATLRRGDHGAWRFETLAISLDTYGGTPPPQLPDK